MKIKLLRNVDGLAKNSVLSVRKISATADDVTYQITDGSSAGMILVCDIFDFTEIENEAIYSEKEYNNLKEFYLEELKKEKEQTHLFQSLARDMANKVKEKNKEIERLNFFLESSSIALMASCEALERLKETKQSR